MQSTVGKNLSVLRMLLFVVAWCIVAADIFFFLIGFDFCSNRLISVKIPLKNV